MRVLFLGSVVLMLGCGQAPGALGPEYGSANTCTSGQSWQGGTSESELMNPGFACRACHLGQNFQGQNPGGAAEPGKAYFFMGTAFSTPHEPDLCAAEGVPADAVVEILDSTDTVKLSLPISAAGNFRSRSTTAGFPLPYKARVVAGGKTAVMAGAQMEGDCNSCHTAAGTGGAPGRILIPQ
jgi:hypothetical protein